MPSSSVAAFCRRSILNDFEEDAEDEDEEAGAEGGAGAGLLLFLLARAGPGVWQLADVAALWAGEDISHVLVSAGGYIFDGIISGGIFTTFLCSNFKESKGKERKVQTIHLISRVDLSLENGAKVVRNLE